MKHNEQASSALQNTRYVEKDYYEDEISLFEILSTLWKRKVFIIFSVLVCTALSVIYLIFNNDLSYKTSALVSLNFPGIEAYNNPDGSTFDKSQMISPAILSKINISGETTEIPESISKKSLINIEDVISETIIKEMKKNPEKRYLTNRFLLSLTTDEAVSLSEIERSKVVLSIINAYKKFFYEKYVKVAELSEKIPNTFLKKNDYVDVIEILKIRIDTVVNILNEKINTAGDFRSAASNKSLADLQGDFEILKNVELSRIRDVVSNLNLTKEKNILIIKLNQKINNLEAESEKENGKALIAQELLEKVSTVSNNGNANFSTSNEGVFETTFIEKLRKEDNLSYLIKIILESKTKANDLRIEKNRTVEIIKELEKGLVTSVNGLNIQYVESALATLVDDYNALSEELNNLNRVSSNIKFANTIKIEQNPITEISSEKNARLVVILSGVASLFIAVFVAFFIEYLSNARREKQSIKEKESDLRFKIDGKQEKAEDFAKHSKGSHVA